jgi:hypothetical protein
MSYEAMEYVLSHSLSVGSSKVILTVIARHANVQGEAWPSLDLLGAYAHIGERAIRNALRDLEGKGELVTVIHGGPVGRSDQRNNLYRVVMPACGCARADTGRIRHAPPMPVEAT